MLSLDILFKFAPGMESGRKNEGFILDLLMQFKGPKIVLLKIIMKKIITEPLIIYPMVQLLYFVIEIKI